MAMAVTARRTKLSVAQRSFHTFNATADARIKTLCQTNRLQVAVEAFKHLLSAKSKSIPSLVTCILLLSSLVRWNQYASALSEYRLMVKGDIFLDLITLNVVINCHCQTGRMDYAFRVFDGMEAHGYLPNVVTFSTVIKGLHRKGKFHEAFGLLSIMLQNGHKPNTITFNILMDQLCKDGKLQEAMELLVQMSNEGSNPDVFTFNFLIDGLRKQGKLDKG